MTTEKGLGQFLTVLKTFKTQKKLHYRRATLEASNTEKGTTYNSKGFNTEKGLECVLLSRNFDFLVGYCSLPNGYYWLLLVTWWLILVTGR